MAAMVRSILFDIAFLGFGGAQRISTIDMQAALVSLAIGILAAFTHSAITDTTRSSLPQ
ncbi:MAG: hypothetical protein JO203_04305 [Gammaproteobacteria bacterium]|nr:hypothetical protein [Gammaproteobacteria bacterium]